MPFNAINMGLEVLRPEEVSMTPEGKEVLEMMRESCKGMKSIIDNTLDFSKIESGSFQIKYDPNSMVKMVVCNDAVCS